MQIVPVDETNRAASYSVLATAFADDPVVRWLVSDPARDAEMFRYLYIATHGAPNSADLMLDDGRAVGASYWDPPGYKASPWASLRSIPLGVKVFRSRLRRGAALDQLFGERRPHEPHWYLSTIGALEPGRGIGTSLLHHRLDNLDGPAYLESSNRANVPLYERFGFQVTEELTLPDDGPKVWTMFRPAR